jgi:aspartate aminotransferase
MHQPREVPLDPLNVRPAAADLDPSQIREISRMGIGREDTIGLWLGEGDAPTPPFIVDAATRALEAGHTFYAPNGGIPELRECLATYMRGLYAIALDTERVTVTASAMNGIMIAVQCIAGAGDNAVIVSPLWPNFVGVMQIMGAEPRFAPLVHDDAGWRLDLDRVIAACDANTRAIVINSPGNPTGWVMSAAEQEALLAFCRARGIWVIADEVYARIVYEGACAPSFLQVSEPEDRLVVVNSFSKSWSMTGWRLGWLVAPDDIGETLEMMNEYNISSPATFIQHAGVTAVREGEPHLAALLAGYRTVRDVVHQRLRAMTRVRADLPAGAFYFFFAVDGLGDSRAFAKRVLDETGIGLAPGSAFGPGGEGHMRLCFARSPERLSEAMDRLAPLLG